MRYLTWRLTWNGNYGYGPEQIAFANGARLEASSWLDLTVEQGTILGYLIGNIDLSLLSDWSVAELSEIDALDFAKTIDPSAFFLDDGRIGAIEDVSGGET